MKLTARQIERLVKQGEVVHTECKDASGGLPDSLWESYSSFANTDGGVIFLGVKEVDRKFSIVGVPKAATLIKRFRDGVNNREKVSVNIFSLIGIGERSGTGLSNLYALWEQHGFATPVIREEFDPEKTIVNIATESNQSVSDNTRTEPDHNPGTTRTEPDQDPSKPRPSPAQSAQGDPRVPQKCPKSAPKTAQDAPRVPQAGPKSAQGAPRVPQECPKGAPRVPQEIGDAPSSVKQVYLAMHEDVAITHRGLESKLGLSKTTIRKATATLIQRGLIRRVGPRFGGHWEVVK